jgi:uroporphyrin-III C-methyltransferase
MSLRKIPRLTVVGAGIGDPELITLKAIRAISNADVILYDALVNPALLDYARPNIIRTYVGKRRMNKAFDQDEINQLIVDQAFIHGHVVRLKGGDPFVFGRGHEEMQYAFEQGLKVSYVPGISSAIAGAGMAGVAVTRRGASRSFWTLTATTDLGEINPELSIAAQTDTTAVILMGMAKLRQIVEIWVAAGKKDCPTLIVQNASCPEQKTICAPVADLEKAAADADVNGPAIVIIGETVNHRFIPDGLGQIGFFTDKIGNHLTKNNVLS